MRYFFRRLLFMIMVMATPTRGGTLILNIIILAFIIAFLWAFM